MEDCMKKILVFIFVILSFYLFLNYLTKDTNLIKKILFDKVSLLNSEKNNLVLESKLILSCTI